MKIKCNFSSHLALPSQQGCLSLPGRFWGCLSPPASNSFSVRAFIAFNHDTSNKTVN